MTSRFGATDREILGLAIPALGALAIDPNNSDVVWVGTGERNALACAWSSRCNSS